MPLSSSGFRFCGWLPRLFRSERYACWDSGVGHTEPRYMPYILSPAA